MTQYVSHRVNTVEELCELESQYGVEIDLRDSLDGDIHINHDPFYKGENFEDYLKQYHHGLMILNIKSERIEKRVLDLVKQYKVQEYFLLDSSFPMIKLLSDEGVKDIALRFSELEGMDTIRNMAGKVKWIWVDCFTKFPLNKKIYQEMKNLGYKLCMVSPELQKQEEKLTLYADFIKREGIIFDTICTKAYNIEKWSRYV